MGYVYDPAIVDKYDAAIEKWLAELPTDTKKQNMLDYVRKHDTLLEDFIAERLETDNRLPGRIDLMDIVSPIWNREKAISQYQFIQLMKNKILEENIDKNGWNEIQENVEEFESRLLKAIYQYNKQMVVQLWQIFGTDIQVLMALENSGIEIDRNKFVEEMNMLDSYYYAQGNMHYLSCSESYEKLNKHELGKLLLLDIKEIHQAAAARHGYTDNNL